MKRLIFLLLVIILPACRKAMQVDGRIKPLQKSEFFSNGMTARLPVEGTVARGELREDSFFWRGDIDGSLAMAIPMAVTRQNLERGRQRFNIFCAACHGQTGEGDGMIVQRGFPAPPTLHEERLRNAPAGYFFGVITHGYGVMYSYADRISVEDRWAIIAYLRVLQLSQNARITDVPEEAQRKLEEQP